MIEIEPTELEIGKMYYIQNIQTKKKFGGIYVGSNGQIKKNYSFFTHLVAYNDKPMNAYLQKTFKETDSHLFRCKYFVYYCCNKFMIYERIQSNSYIDIIEKYTDRTHLPIKRFI